MALRYRRMKPKDVDSCVAIVASHPIYGPRFGREIRSLGPALSASLSLESLRAVVFEEALPHGAVRLIGDASA